MMRIVDLRSDDTETIQQVAALLVAGFKEHWPDAWPDMDSALQEVQESCGPRCCNPLSPAGAHRLAPMVAGMLQYAANVAYEKYGDDPEEGSVAHSLLLASEVYDPDEAVELFDLISQLFEDAEVEYERVDHRGDEYSIVDSAIYEFIHWYDMPWEA